MKIALSKVVLRNDCSVPFVNAQDRTLTAGGGDLELDTDLRLVITHPRHAERGEQLIPCETIAYMAPERTEFKTIQGERALNDKAAKEKAEAEALAQEKLEAELLEAAKREEIAQRVKELVARDAELAKVDPAMLTDAVEKQLEGEKVEQEQAAAKLEAADQDDTVSMVKDPDTGEIKEVRGRARFAKKIG